MIDLFLDSTAAQPVTVMSGDAASDWSHNFILAMRRQQGGGGVWSGCSVEQAAQRRETTSLIIINWKPWKVGLCPVDVPLFPARLELKRLDSQHHHLIT